MKRTQVGPREHLGSDKFNALTGHVHEDGQQWYDSVRKNMVFDTGHGVGFAPGARDYIEVINKTGVLLTAGMIVSATGVDATTNKITVDAAIADGSTGSPRYIGCLPLDIINDGEGIAIVRGLIPNIVTTGITAGLEVYLSDTVAGTFTTTPPTAPSHLVGLGGVTITGAAGELALSVERIDRPFDISNYPFSQGNVGAGTYYAGGFYEAPTIDTTLSVGGTQVYGSANNAFCAHAFIVSAAVPTITGGVAGLRVNGDSITDTGILTLADSDILSEDISTLSINDYLETTKKWIGTITFEIYTVSGTPTGSHSFNYGFAKYEDYGNNKFTVAYFEVVGLAGATDTVIDFELMHHKPTGHTYAATGFVPGDGNITSFKAVLGASAQIYNDLPFSFKITDLDQLVDGSASEGILVRITPTANNSVTSMNARVGIFIEPIG